MALENYILKKEVDWSVLTAGITFPLNNQVVFGQIANRFLNRGERKTVKLFLDGVSYTATITNVAFSDKYKDSHKADILQLRYSTNSDLAIALRQHFPQSYRYLDEARKARAQGDRKLIKLPDGAKEYLVMYTTEYDDTYVLETILSSDVDSYRKSISDMGELEVERDFDHLTDPTAGFTQVTRNVNIRKLNRAIGNNLKLLYGYRCQICGQLIGAEYGTHIAEVHHIDYYSRSLNNDASNQMVVCPNHHGIIHERNPVFQRKNMTFIYPNGYEEALRINLHLT